MCLLVELLTFLYAWGDGQQGDDEAQAAVDAQEDLVKQTGLRVGVEQTHEDYSSYRSTEQHQSHKGQSCVPQAIILYSWTPGDRKTRGRERKQTAERKNITWTRVKQIK